MSGETATIRCHGRIVSETAAELKDLVKPMIPKVRRIVLDLSDVSFIDSSGLGSVGQSLGCIGGLLHPRTRQPFAAGKRTAGNDETVQAIHLQLSTPPELEGLIALP